MKSPTQFEAVLASMKLLNLALLQAIHQLHETCSILSREFDLPLSALDESNCKVSELFSRQNDNSFSNRPIADRDTLSAVFQEKTCFLGNTLQFRLFEILAARPNRYFSHSELLDKVWGGVRTDSAIRNVVKHLREKLSAAGLGELAASIDGTSARGHYGLRLRRN